jgi:hypothetical protein
MEIMFRENNQHKQQSIFDTTFAMDDKIKEKLEKTWAPVFYENVFCQIEEKPFAILFGTTGTPNFPINILLSLEYIKHMKDISDTQLMESYYFDYLVNYAVGSRILGEKHLSERTIYNFRKRIYQHCLNKPDNDGLLFDQFISLLKNFAIKAGVSFDEQRMDTTMFMSNIKKAGRLALAFDVLVEGVKAVPEEKRTNQLVKVLDSGFKTEILFKTKASESDTKLTQLLNLCKDAYNILKNIDSTSTVDQIRILERFIHDQSNVDETGKLLPKRKNEISSDSLQSAYDEDATYRKKSGVGQSGYVLEIAETCSEKNPFQLITDFTVKTNKTSDVEIIQERMPIIKENTDCEDMYVDGGFHSPKVLEVAKEENIKVHLTDMSGTEPTKKLPISDYKIDEESNIILECPKHQVPINVGVSNSQTVAHFPKSACENCEFKERCHVKPQKKDFVVRITLKSIIASRERYKIDLFQKENTSKRAGIEGSNSALKRKGLKKVNVRGKVPTTIVAGYKVMAQNIKRFTKFILGKYKQKNPKNNIVMPLSV